MGASILAFPHRKDTARDWTNEELAELYRVVDILGRAGVEVEIEMGLSDEGDPWLVMCRAETGDVLAHFARIDGQFLAASPTLDSTFRGANFRAIVDQLARSQPLMVPPPSQTGGTRLFMHPSVVLTAFVATALLQMQQYESDDVGVSVPTEIEPETDAAAADAGADGGEGKAGLSQALQFMLRGGAPAGGDERSGASAAEKAAAQTISLASVIAIAMSIVQRDTGAAPTDEAELTADGDELATDEGGSGPQPDTGAETAAIEQASMAESKAANDGVLRPETADAAPRQRGVTEIPVVEVQSVKMDWAIMAQVAPSAAHAVLVTASAEAGDAFFNHGMQQAGLVIDGEAAGSGRAGSASEAGSDAAADADSGSGKASAASGSATSTTTGTDPAGDDAESGSSTEEVPETLRTDLRLVSVDDVSAEALDLLLSGDRGIGSRSPGRAPQQDERDTADIGDDAKDGDADTDDGVDSGSDGLIADRDDDRDDFGLDGDRDEDTDGRDGADGGGVTDEPGLFHTIAEFLFSERNTITTALQPSHELVDALEDYVSQNGSGPIRLVIFSSEDLAGEIFPFVPGVLFVERSHIGNADLPDLTELPAGDGDISLVGVIDVDGGLSV